MAMAMAQPHSFARELLARLQNIPPHTYTQQTDLPPYDYGNVEEQDRLVTSSSPASFRLGTGASIYSNALLPAILTARSEVILVTCFWAKSTTLNALRDTLEAVATHRRLDPASASTPLRIRICLSSAGLFQKLLHTSSRDGYTYPSSSWASKLGLPPPSTLEAAGIDLAVKSLFFLPFSVMHPKFVIVDRQRAFLPSCNISWEAWLEGCVEISGPAVSGLVTFYERSWEREQQGHQHAMDHLPATPSSLTSMPTSPSSTVIRSTVDNLVDFQDPSNTSSTMPTVLLPSSHHRSPKFRPFPWQSTPQPPPTPLNMAMLQLFESANDQIYIQTPNLTCQPVIASLLHAIQRGVHVNIVTNTGMMLVEQLVTAGTTTEWCVKRFLRQYKSLRTSASKFNPSATSSSHGKLQISYFHPLRTRPSPGDEEQGHVGEEPAHSHLKLTIVDGQYTVLGSGNMDRPSWFTSQELGILFHGTLFAKNVKSAVDLVLEGRLDTRFDSTIE